MAESTVRPSASNSRSLSNRQTNTYRRPNRSRRNQARQPFHEHQQFSDPNQAYYEYDQAYWYQPEAYATHHQHYYLPRHDNPRPAMRRNPPATTVRPQKEEVTANKNRTAGKTKKENENLRSILTDQLLKNKYECMICIVKIG
jgi:hypothetical protein